MTLKGRWPILIMLALFLFPRIGEGLVIRVGLINSEPLVRLSTTGYCDIIDLSTDRIILTTYGWADGFVKATATGLYAKGLGCVKGPLLLRPIVGAIGRVNGQAYRGEFEVARTSQGLRVVNVVDLEEYLYGVLKCEIGNDASLETLKAQAVIARTFAIANLGKHKSEGFHLCPYVHCQIYKGVEVETLQIIKAIEVTRGQVLSYDGDIAQTFYHASCGGFTADAVSVWGKHIPYLQELACPFCQRAPKSHYWQAAFKITDIQDALNRNGLQIGKISSITTSPGRQRCDLRQRVEAVVIEHSGGVTKIQSNKFRFLLGPTKIWSTNFSVTNDGQRVTFRGMGKGHGVGLCQWGARVMGEMGYNYKQILGFYYPGVFLRSVVFEGGE